EDAADDDLLDRVAVEAQAGAHSVQRTTQDGEDDAAPAGQHLEERAQTLPAGERAVDVEGGDHRPRGTHRCTLPQRRATERQRRSGHTRPAWPGNAGIVTAGPTALSKTP